MSLAQFAAQELARQAVNRGRLKIPAPRKASESIFCPQCRDRGRAVAGTVFIDGKMLCSDHAQQGAAPGRKNMPKRRVIDWDPLDPDVVSDVPAAEVAKKHGLTLSQVYNRRWILNHKNGSAKRKAKKARRKSTQAGLKLNSAHAVIEDLRLRRALLDRAIAALEDLQVHD